MWECGGLRGRSAVFRTRLPPQMKHQFSKFSSSSSSDTPRTKVVLQVVSSQLPAPHLLRVLQLYHKVASSHLPAPQIAPRTKVVLESQLPRDSAHSSCTSKSPVLSFQLHRFLRVLQLYYKVPSSQLPAPQIAPRTVIVLQTRQFSASSSTAY